MADYVFSPLTQITKLSMNKSNPRGEVKVKKITIHHTSGKATTLGVLTWFQDPNCGGSANYVIDYNGTIGGNVPENYRAWTSNSAQNDYQAITIELVNDGGAPYWHVADLTIKRCVELCIDICNRYNIERIEYTGDSTGNLTRHNMFVGTDCPGPYLQAQFPAIAETINRVIDGTPGDVNCDGKLNARDVTMLMKAIVNGATSLLVNADYNGDGKVNARDVTAMMKSMVGSKPTTGVTFKVGDKVKMRVGANKYYDGKRMPSWVTAATLYVREIQESGKKIVISTQPTGAITGVVKAEDLILAKDLPET